MVAKKVEKARQIIRENYNPTDGIFFKGGKETMVMMDIMRKLYVELKNPFIFLDGGQEPEELYKFIEEMEKKYHMDLYTFGFSTQEKKIAAIDVAIKTLGLEKIFVAIRRDENKAREKENYVSKRDNHIRIHPMLDFTEKDIWEYIKENKVPYCKLYDEGYRSLGDGAQKSGKTERSGRNDEKERIMKVFREMGYF